MKYTLDEVSRTRSFVSSLWSLHADPKIIEILSANLPALEEAACKAYPLDNEEKVLVDLHDKTIDAIKHYRTRWGCGLHAAKLVVDYYKSNK